MERQWTIRRATVGDAENWVACHQACWREAYGPLVRPELLEAQLADVPAWVQRTRATIAAGDHPRWVALHGEEVIGFSVGGPAREELAHLAPEQLRAVYVRSAWHGTGLGQALLERALGTAAACLEVLEDNHRARAFYERNGFADTGIRKVFGRLDAWERVLARPARHALRPATLDDVAFLTDVVIEATRDQGRFPDDFDDSEFRAGFAEWTEEQVRDEVPGSSTYVVEVDAERVGRLRVVRTDDYVELAGIQLLPAHQGHGLGGTLLREVAAEAYRSGRPLRLAVEKDNPRARAFYQGYGMTWIDETEQEDVLELALPSTPRR